MVQFSLVFLTQNLGSFAKVIPVNGEETSSKIKSASISFNGFMVNPVFCTVLFVLIAKSATFKRFQQESRYPLVYYENRFTGYGGNYGY